MITSWLLFWLAHILSTSLTCTVSCFTLSYCAWKERMINGYTQPSFLSTAFSICPPPSCTLLRSVTLLSLLLSPSLCHFFSVTPQGPPGPQGSPHPQPPPPNTMMGPHSQVPLLSQDVPNDYSTLHLTRAQVKRSAQSRKWGVIWDTTALCWHSCFFICFHIGKNTVISPHPCPLDVCLYPLCPLA